MAKKKNKKHAQKGVTSSIGGDFEAHRQMSAKGRNKRSRHSKTLSREDVRREIRIIIDDAKQTKSAIKKEMSHAAKNGIKDLIIDGARMMDFLKDIKFKESPSQSKESQQIATVRPEPVRTEPSQSIGRKKRMTYYDAWYNLIYSELKSIKKTTK